MAALDFPASPDNGDVYEGFIYSSAKGVWRSLAVVQSLLDNLTDVTITSPADGDLLTYDDSGSLWTNSNNLYDATKLFLANPSYSSNYSFETGYNGFTIGPVTIQSGVTVTVPTGTIWIIF